MSICYFLLRLEKVQNISQNGFPKTRVRIKKQSKSNELGAPTLNSISKLCLNYFPDKNVGKSWNNVEKKSKSDFRELESKSKSSLNWYSVFRTEFKMKKTSTHTVLKFNIIWKNIWKRWWPCFFLGVFSCPLYQPRSCVVGRATNSSDIWKLWDKR